MIFFRKPPSTPLSKCGAGIVPASCSSKYRTGPVPGTGHEVPLRLPVGLDFACLSDIRPRMDACSGYGSFPNMSLGERPGFDDTKLMSASRAI